jgi:hypothetical protein
MTDALSGTPRPIISTAAPPKQAYHVPVALCLPAASENPLTASRDEFALKACQQAVVRVSQMMPAQDGAISSFCLLDGAFSLSELVKRAGLPGLTRDFKVRKFAYSRHLEKGILLAR